MDDQRREVLEAELAEHRKKRDQEDQIIQTLSLLLGLSETATAESPSATNAGGAASTTGSPSGSPSLVRQGEFYRMSATKAAKAVLERSGYRNALKTEQILAAIQKGGAGGIGGKNPATALYKNLWRDDEFEKVGGGLWGLSAWYGGKTKKSEDETPKPKRRKARKAAAKRQTKPKLTVASGQTEVAEPNA